MTEESFLPTQEVLENGFQGNIYIAGSKGTVGLLDNYREDIDSFITYGHMRDDLRPQGTYGYLVLPTVDPTQTAVLVAVSKLHPAEKNFNKAVGREVVSTRLKLLIRAYNRAELSSYWWEHISALGIPNSVYQDDPDENSSLGVSPVRFRDPHSFLKESVRRYAEAQAYNLLEDLYLGRVPFELSVEEDEPNKEFAFHSSESGCCAKCRGNCSRG